MVGRKKLFQASLCVAVVLFHTVLFLSPWGQRLDTALLDLWFRIRGSASPSDEVVIVGMDEASYQNLGVPMNEGWPRSLHARLLSKLREAGAARVAFDVLFFGPGSDPVSDNRFAAALSEIPAVIGADQGERAGTYGTSYELILPHEPFIKSAAEVALVGLPEEFDRIRRFRLFDPAVPLRPLAMAAANVGERAMPSPRDFINFYGPAGTIPTYSYYQLLEEEVPFPAHLVRGKTVFVGLLLRSGVGPSQKDSFLTPFADRGRTFGVEIHATAASNLMTGGWIGRLPVSHELWMLTVLLVSICALCIRIPPVPMGVLLVVIAGAWAGVSYHLFLRLTYLPGLTLFGVCAPLVYVVSTLTSYFIARRGKRQLQRAFGYYLSPHMASVVSKNAGSLALGGEKVYATALFTDIAGFTSLSESLSAEAVTQLLNEYFTELVESVFEYEGTLIKFIGDSLFAIWGAPIKLENHAEAALSAAISMQARLASSSRLQRQPLVTRIGIHTGQMVVGNLGSSRRFDFTAIGDSVNVASRVEGLNKFFGTSILCTGAVVEEMGQRNDLLYIGKIKVVGKQEDTALFAVLDEERTGRASSLWLEAVAFFQSREWEKAAEHFMSCRRSFDYLEKASSVYLEHIDRFRSSPPEGDWSGSLTAKEK